jgi:hypothetical protein
LVDVTVSQRNRFQNQVHDGDGVGALTLASRAEGNAMQGKGFAALNEHRGQWRFKSASVAAHGKPLN